MTQRPRDLGCHPQQFEIVPLSMEKMMQRRGREGAVPYLSMAVVRFGMEGKKGVSGSERASPQGSDDAILPVLQQGCPPKFAIASDC
ncbi:hypothetical protein MRB53_013780 [Persea americana]|uniref:Uncharacterized protein n=1 Tax=Persea americana TaxID=3435 RepID=A0ACC2K9G7_PERAE|nr:hypothetical protein MRB53_013780 [Persea americana]